MADLDALLGIKEEPPAPASPASDSSSAASGSNAASTSSTSNSRISVSPTALDKMADAEAQRRSGADPSKRGAVKSDMEDRFQRIIDRARKLSEEQKEGGTGAPASSASEQEQEALKREFEALLEVITKPSDMIDKDDIKRLKDACFGPLTFWVTETRPIQEAERTGLLIRGNLRTDKDKVFETVKEKVQELFGGKYVAFMVEDAEAARDGPAPLMGASSSEGSAEGFGDRAKKMGKEMPRVAFQIIPANQAQPQQTDNLQRAAAAILGALLVVSCLQLGLATNITKLPAETLAWFANPANLNSDQLPPGLENWDPTAYFESALPILEAVLGINLAHEVAHRLMAMYRGVTLGPSFFIPFAEVGSFGAITPFTSLLKDRQTLWDVAFVGPATGFAVSLGLLLFGLAQSTGVDATADPAAAEALVAVPTNLFQGSLLLGGFTRLVLGESALRGATVLVSPLLIAGWSGLITSALNFLPVGSLDGGRMMQAAFGRNTLSLTSFYTYLGLGLGLLGSSLALPFGLYVIICQRTAEKYIQDSVTVPSKSRLRITMACVLAAVLILCPMAPEIADSFGVGLNSASIM